MNIKKTFTIFAVAFALAAVCATQAAAQNVMNLKAVGNGEKVRLTISGKSKIVALEGNSVGDFTAGGDPPHRYTTLLSVQKGAAFYLVAKFVSGAAISDPNAPCGGDRPTTLLLVKANKNLTLEHIQTEIIDSCSYNRYVKGKPLTTKNKVSISYEESGKKYTLTFNINEAEKGLQLNER